MRSSMSRRVEETSAHGADIDERFPPVTRNFRGCEARDPSQKVETDRRLTLLSASLPILPPALRRNAQLKLNIGPTDFNNP
jgi:hypothetical protein